MASINDIKDLFNQFEGKIMDKIEVTIEKR